LGVVAAAVVLVYQQLVVEAVLVDIEQEQGFLLFLERLTP
jgi:hypothetical protein